MWCSSAQAFWPAIATIPLLLLHHHFPSGCIWLDQYSLRCTHILVELLQLHPLVKTLVCGNLHKEFDIDWLGWCHTNNSSHLCAV
ncbi:MAG: hypothetical protein ACMUEK_02285 [Sodalis sp. (in: enterobacteria)]